MKSLWSYISRNLPLHWISEPKPPKGWWVLAGLFIGVIFLGQCQVQESPSADEALPQSLAQVQLHIQQNHNLLLLLNEVLAQMEAEKPTGIQAGTLDRLAEISRAFVAYPDLEKEGAEGRKRSPERGQLLIALAHMGLDSLSVDRLAPHVSFAQADLRGVDLNRAYLKGVNLHQADLQDASLWGAELSKANCWGANFQGANLSHAHLTATNFKTAILDWAKLDESQMARADFNGASLASVSLRRVAGQASSFMWTDMRGASLQGGDFSGANLVGAELIQANLEGAILNEADVRRTDMTEAHLVDVHWQKARLSRLVVQGATVSRADWLEKLTDWEAENAADMQQAYVLRPNPGTAHSFWLDHP